jgi:hypothetical protein
MCIQSTNNSILLEAKSVHKHQCMFVCWHAEYNKIQFCVLQVIIYMCVCVYLYISAYSIKQLCYVLYRPQLLNANVLKICHFVKLRTCLWKALVNFGLQIKKFAEIQSPWREGGWPYYGWLRFMTAHNNGDDLVFAI